jgi:TolB-like protein/class 3 adenylate cyclase
LIRLDRRRRLRVGCPPRRKELNGERVERRLAAILAADVVGYSRLVGEDEAGTLRLLQTYRRELIDPQITENRGRIVKTTGDGFLAEFGSTVDALRCANEIQTRMGEQNASDRPSKRIEFRIGIHQGDIVIADDGDIFGDGVNIAARLETLAEPGGICVSARVQEDAAGKLAIAFRDLGEQRLRNIARPVHVYAFGPPTPAGTIQPGSRSSRWRWLGVASVIAAIAFGIVAWHMLPQRSAPINEPTAVSAPAPPGIVAHRAPRLSVVVLPFTNLSNDPDQEYFGDAITDDLTTDLSRITGSFVIARTTAFTYKGKAADVKQIGRDLGVRYVLEGSVRRLGERVQVNVQLIDAETGAHAWADRFDTNRRDLAEAQSEITGRLARSLGLELVNQAARRIADNPDAADQVLKARAIANQPFSRENREKTLQAFERALEMDPTSIDARIGIAMALASGPEGNGPATPQDAARVEQLLREVMDRDPDRSDAYRTVATLRTAQGRWEEAEFAFRTALALDPNDAAARRNLGQTLQRVGNQRPPSRLSKRHCGSALEIPVPGSAT